MVALMIHHDVEIESLHGNIARLGVFPSLVHVTIDDYYLDGPSSRRGVIVFEFGDPPATDAPAPPLRLDSSARSPLFLRNATCRIRCLAILS